MAELTRYTIPGLNVVEHGFELPLDHADPQGETIQVYARELGALERGREQLPWLVFLQGGPGFGAPRPLGRTGWISAAVERYRVLLLDQRGNARSSRQDADTLGSSSPVHQARRLGHFRADSIVRDAEAIRRQLCEDRPWTLLGQSYGGFCALSYLSSHPEGLEAAIITGGIPPIGVPIDDVYRATYRRVSAKNQAFYRRYPQDRERARRVVDCLAQREVMLPSGTRLTPRRFQQLGLLFGFSDGFETVHYLLEEAFDRGELAPSFNFLHGIEHALPYDTNPIFSVLHEAAYCEGSASRWAAQRVRAEFPEFETEGGGAVSFTGEMIYPWMFEEYGRLAPLREAAQLVADREDWPRLYDEGVLSRNETPVVAAVYAEDMYVEREFSEAVAARVPGVRTWLTNEYEHNGLRADGEAVLGRLLAMLEGHA